jgi:sulfide:quinone oxidoreductase
MQTSQRVIIVGAGPGGLAAAHTLAIAGVSCVLVTRDGTARFLPGVLPTLFDVRPVTSFQHAITAPHITMLAGEVTRITTGQVHLADGTLLAAEAIIAAPGLATDPTALPPDTHTRAVWDLADADQARAYVAQQRGGRIIVVIAGLPYRCPPAPYGLALALAAQQRGCEVILTTPEPRPLQPLGEAVSAFLEDLATQRGVRIETTFIPDGAAWRAGELAAQDGRRLPYDLALVVPPHRRPACLADFPGTGALITVDAMQRSAVEGVWAVGDCTATLLPRAAGVAEAQGRTAAASVLAALGNTPPPAPVIPAPSCYVWTGQGNAARIQISYPQGLPPAGQPVVTLDPPSAALYAEALQASEVWAAGLTA